MKFQELELSKIKPDPNQPRKSFNRDKIQELSQTIESVGIINPIEVDPNFVIITGENRYRAAKLLGLKKVPVKILEVSKDERFLRQVVENIQYANLTPIEIAEALKKLLANLAAKSARDKHHKGSYHNKGIKDLAKLIGKDEGYIEMYLSVLEASKPIQKAIEGGLPITHLQALNRVNPKFKERLEKKILSGDIKNRDAVRYVVDAMDRNPEKAKQILDLDYSKYETSQEVAEALAKISPRLSDQIKESIKPPEALNQIAQELHKWCQDYDRKNLGQYYVPQLAITFLAIQKDVNDWIAQNELTLLTE